MKRIALSLLSLAVAALLWSPGTAQATTVLSPTAKITFTFDDGLATTYTTAAPILQRYGLTGTSYVITNCVGMTTVPNKCLASQDDAYMTWAQVQALQNSYGWEIGSHTVDHKCLVSSRTTDPDTCPQKALTQAQVTAELINSKTALASHGITATSFAPPYGDYNNYVLSEVAKFYSSMRGFAEQGTNDWGASDYLLRTLSVQEGTTPVATIEAAIDQAMANNTWLVLSFHDIQTAPSTNPDDYEYGAAELEQLAAYVQAKQVGGGLQNTNVTQGIPTGDSNLMPNSTFDAGISQGWSTDAPAAIKANNANHGSYPSPTNAIEFTGTTSATHLFSPRIAVDPQQSYLLKSFINVDKNPGGIFAFYIDEYDAAGNWISGQYKGGESGSFVETMNFVYKPTSTRVAKSSLQFIALGSGVHAYLDNVQWYSENQPVVTPPPVTNLLTTPNFSAGWHTNDASAVTVTSGAVNVTAGATTSYLFSPLVSVDAATSYLITNQLNLTQINSSVLAYYIDEYDANGNWISGQYKLDKAAPLSDTIGFSYQPTSAAVKQASLQVIFVGGSGIKATINNISWTTQ